MKMLQRFPLFLALFLIGADTAFADTADVVFLNGNVLTVDDKDRVADAVAIRGDRILAVGTNEEIQKLSAENTRQIDLAGKSVVPGLIETHCHSLFVARASLGAPYEDYGNIEEMQAVIARIAQTLPEGAWLTVPRVEITRLTERRHPTTAELDAACSTHPVVFNASRKYALNSMALEILGFGKGDDPESVDIVRDAEGGIRLLGNNAGALIVKHTAEPEPPEAELLEALRHVHGIYNSVGITSIFERAMNRSGWNLFSKLREEDQLTVRIAMTFRQQMNSAEKVRRFVSELRLYPRQGDDWLRAGPLKIMVDGGIHWGNTYLSEPFGPKRNTFYALPEDPDYRGDIHFSVEELAEVFAEGHRLGWQMGCHVTGDAGIERVLDALEQSAAEVPVKGKRFNVMHAYFNSPSIVERAAELGLGVDTQAYTYYKDADFISNIYGLDWAERFIGLGGWYHGGVHVSPNSDHMVGLDPNRSMNSFNPFLMLYIAVSRKDELGNVHGEHQKLSRLEALRSITMHAAWQSFDDETKGSLEPGKLADLVILDRNYLDCPEDEIRDILPLETFVGGKSVFQRETKE